MTWAIFMTIIYLRPVQKSATIRLNNDNIIYFFILFIYSFIYLFIYI